MVNFNNAFNSIKNFVSPGSGGSTKVQGSPVEDTEPAPALSSVQEELQKGLAKSGADNIHNQPDKMQWETAKGPSAFSEVFKMPECVKNAWSSTASVMQKCLKAMTESKTETNKTTANPNQLYFEKPLTKEGEVVLNNILKFGFSDGFKTLSNDEKLHIIDIALSKVKVSDPHDKILLQLMSKTELGNAFETVCKNAYINENLEFLKSCKSYQKDRDPETLKNLQNEQNLKKLNLLNASIKNALVVEGKVGPAFEEITKLLISDLNTKNKGKLSLDENQIKADKKIEEEVKSQVHDLAFDDGHDDASTFGINMPKKPPLEL